MQQSTEINLIKAIKNNNLANVIKALQNNQKANDAITIRNKKTQKDRFFANAVDFATYIQKNGGVEYTLYNRKKTSNFDAIESQKIITLLKLHQYKEKREKGSEFNFSRTVKSYLPFFGGLSQKDQACNKTQKSGGVQLLINAVTNTNFQLDNDTDLTSLKEGRLAALAKEVFKVFEDNSNITQIQNNIKLQDNIKRHNTNFEL